MLSSLYIYRKLIWRMINREVASRYKGSVIGIAWSFINPLLMLSVYTFVFSVVFQAKWHSNLQGSRGEFAVILFTGMIVFNIFAECITRAPTLILSNVNYVKKIVFPLEILPWVIVGNAIFHAIISSIVLFIAELFILHYIPWTVLFTPIIFIPYILSLIGMVWILSSLGVYLRDLGQVVGLLTTVLMFTSPLFFPLSALPEKFQQILVLNPLAYFIEETRSVVIFSTLPRVGSLLIAYVASFIFAYFGFFLFQKTRKGFADVI